MAIHQKLALTQRLEELDMASEVRNTPRRTRGGKFPPRGGATGGQDRLRTPHANFANRDYH
jgi:hypothetical protein